MGLHFTLSPGWHVYWKNSGDAGFPPVAVFQPEANLGKPELLWPSPRRFDLPGDLVAFGYEGEVVYPVRAEIQADGEETLTIQADVDYLVCEVDCIPYRYTLSLEQPVGDEPAVDPETDRLLETWWSRLPRPAGQVPGVQTGAAIHAGGAEGPELEVRVAGARAKEGAAGLFLEPHEVFDMGRPRARVTPDGVVFRVPLRPKQAGQGLPEKTVFAWTVTGLTREGKPLDLEARRGVEVWKEGGAAPGEGGGSGGGLAWMLLLAFVGGALLNLAPTVLALLAVEIPSLRSTEGRGVRERAAAVATGILGGCWGVAALALVARRSGLEVGWGTQLQEPAVAALLALAAALLTLNLWGLLEAPLAPAGRPTGTGRHLLAGLFAVPLALAWTLPPLGGPVGFALERGPAAVCAVFGALGLGLALPFLILAAVPALALALPAPGRWTELLREGLGFLAGASTLWLLYALSRQVSPEGLAWVELVLLVMALLAWLRRRADGRSALRFGLAVALAACAAASLWLADENRLSPRSPSAGGQGTQLTTRFTGGY
jgi:suppressor for copper-sensitivity B